MPVNYFDGPRGAPGVLVTGTDSSGAVRRYVVPAVTVVGGDGTSSTPAGSSTDPYSNVSRGAGSIANGQVAVTTAATQVVPSRAGRSAVTLSSATAVAYWVGASGVTNVTGISIPATAGAGITLSTSAAVFAVGASAVTITYIETF